MGGPKWTAEQWAAITVRNANLLVAAAAGAGKTAVLVERLIKQITDVENPVDVDRLLVVTFTKAAAAEMRERIGLAIAKELNNHPGSRHLNRQATLLSRASITTLHSFCLDITRSFFYLLDLDPTFRIADDTEGALLRLEALEELFEEKYTLGDEGFIALVDAYGGDRDDNLLKEMVLELYNFSISNPWPEHWLKGVAALYNPEQADDLENHPWGRTILSWARQEIASCQLKLGRALTLVNSPGGPEPYRETINQDLVLLAELLQALNKSWEEGYRLFAAESFSKLKSCRSKDIDDGLKERVKNIREEVKKGVKTLQEKVFCRPPEELWADITGLAGVVEDLTGLVIEFRQRYSLKKAAKALVDFADLEHYCLKVLLDPESAPNQLMPSQMAMELRNYYREVLVDEYQDVNQVQETILQMISRQGEDQPNLFMVGDVKQSIYRFRLAEPGLFMDKYLTFPRGEAELNLGIDLAKNFRSRQEVVDGVNFVFRQIMSGPVGEMEYDDKARLVCGAQFLPRSLEEDSPPDLAIELHLLEKSPEQEEFQEEAIDAGKAEDTEEEETLDALQREARVVALRIRTLIQGDPDNQELTFEVYDKDLSGYRPVQYRDIVILMRATRGAAGVFLEEFRKAGIPGYADLSAGYFNAIEVETMMALLRVIDNPRQDIPLAAVLRSSLVGLSAEELAVLKLHSKGKDFFEVLTNLAAMELVEETPLPEGYLIEKVSAFLNSLESWRTMARQGSLADLIWQLYNATGYYAYAGAMPGGAQRQANLRALHDRARQYEATSFRGLFRFLRFIEKFQESGQDLGAARALGEKEDVVRIISIHKSKGLEFPVVFVAGLGKKFNTNDLRRKALLHKELGLGLPVVDPELRLTYPSLAQLAINKRLQTELLAEEMRILYVALTRAREKLILVGAVRDITKAAEKWCQNVNHDHWALPQSDIAAAANYLDWLGSAVARHPEGQFLRQLAGIEALPAVVTSRDPSRWNIIWHGKIPGLEFFIRAESPDQSALWDRVRNLEPVEITAGLGEVVSHNLNWSYPHPETVLKPAKVAVSEVKRKFTGLDREEDAFLPYQTNIIERPRFLREKTGLSASELGTAMHMVMQHLDFQGQLTIQGIGRQVDAMVQKEILTLEDRQAIDIQAIAGLFNTPLGKRILRAKVVRREIPFTLGLPAHLVHQEIPSTGEEIVVVQGVIDCLLEEEDGLVLIDYKTNYVKSEVDLVRITEEYRGQMNLYSLAIESSLKKKVKEKYLYLFSIGQDIKI